MPKMSLILCDVCFENDKQTAAVTMLKALPKMRPNQETRKAKRFLCKECAKHIGFNFVPLAPGEKPPEKKTRAKRSK